MNASGHRSIAITVGAGGLLESFESASNRFDAGILKKTRLPFRPGARTYPCAVYQNVIDTAARAPHHSDSIQAARHFAKRVKGMTIRSNLLRAGWVLCASGACSSAALIVNIGSHDIQFGSTAAPVIIPISGGDPLTDMAGLVQIGDGGPLVGGTAGPVITSIHYDGSIWQAAPGGFTSFISAALPSQVLDPSVSLNVGGQAVGGAGILLTLLVDVSGFPVGSTFDLKLAGTAAGDTALSRSGGSLVTSITNGTIQIVAVPEPTAFVGLTALAVLMGTRARRTSK